MSALAGTFGGLLESLASAFAGGGLTTPPADLTGEELEAYFDLLVSRAESAGLVQDAARRAGIRPTDVLGRVGNPSGPGNNRNRRRVLARLVLALRDRLARTTKPLLAAARSLVSWLPSFKRDITVGHGAAAMLAHGTTQPAPGIVASVAKVVAKQWGYARNFAGQIATGAHVLGKATLSRAAQYANAAWTTFMQAQLDVAKMTGKTEARRILGLADHCHDNPKHGTSGCVELARKGWVDINTVVPIGRATCRNACHCNITFR